MPDFNVDIKVDAEQADAALGRVRAEFERTERTSKAAAEVVKRGLADGSIAADKAATAQRAYAKSFVDAEKAAEKEAATVLALAMKQREAILGVTAAIEQKKAAMGGMAPMLSGIAGELAKINTSLGGMAGSSNGIAAMIGNFGLAGQAVGGLLSAVGGAAQALVDFNVASLKMDDGLIQIRNRLRGVTTGQEQLGQALNLTRELADRTATGWSSTVDVFARTAGVTNQLGFSLDRTARFTETLGKMMGSSGRSTGETSAAMLQFSQALGSGVLQGDEFKSIAENMPMLLDVFAKQLGVTRGALKEMAADGKITTDIMIKGIESMAETADVKFAQMEKTFSQRIQPMMNEFEADPTKMDRLGAAAVGGNLEAIPELVSTLSKMPELVPGIKKLGESFGIDFNPKVSEADKLIGVMTQSLDRLNKALGGQAVPAAKSWEEQVKAITDAYKKAHPEVYGFETGLEKLLESIKKVSGPEGLEASIKKTDAQAEAFDRLKASADLTTTFNNAKKAILDFLKPVGAQAEGVGAKIEEAIAIFAHLARGDKFVTTHDAWAGETTNWEKNPWGINEDDINKLLELQKKGSAIWKALEESVNGGVRTFNRDTGLMNVMLKTGVISLDQYTEALKKMTASLSDFDKARSSAATHSVFGAPTGTGIGMPVPGAQSAMWADLERNSRANLGSDRFVTTVGSEGLPPTLSGIGSTPSNDNARDEFGLPIRPALASDIDWKAIEAAKQRQLDMLEQEQKIYELHFEPSFQRQIKLAKELYRLQEQKAQVLATALKPVEDAFDRLFEHSGFGFRKMVDAMIRDLRRLAMQKLFQGLIAWGVGPSPASAIGAAGMGGGLSPGQAFGSSGNTGATPSGFATGGSFMVGGNGGTDTTPVIFKATRGERVTVQTPGQQAQNSNAGSTNVNVRVSVPRDPRRDLLDLIEGPDGPMFAAKLEARRR